MPPMESPSFLALEATKVKAWWERDEVPPCQGPEAGEDPVGNGEVLEAAEPAELLSEKEEAPEGAPKQPACGPSRVQPVQ